MLPIQSPRVKKKLYVITNILFLDQGHAVKIIHARKYKGIIPTKTFKNF